jgi:hypothetical protein
MTACDGPRTALLHRVRPPGRYPLAGRRLSDGLYGEVDVTTNGGIFKYEMMKAAGI